MVHLSRSMKQTTSSIGLVFCSSSSVSTMSASECDRRMRLMRFDSSPRSISVDVRRPSLSVYGSSNLISFGFALTCSIAVVWPMDAACCAAGFSVLI